MVPARRLAALLALLLLLAAPLALAEARTRTASYFGPAPVDSSDELHNCGLVIPKIGGACFPLRPGETLVSARVTETTGLPVVALIVFKTHTGLPAGSHTGATPFFCNDSGPVAVPAGSGVAFVKVVQTAGTACPYNIASPPVGGIIRFASE